VTQRTQRVLYGAFLGAIIALVITALVASRTFAGHYTRPAFFRTFRVLFYLQQGLFVGLLVAGAAPLSARLRSGALRTALYLLATACVAWLCIWAPCTPGSASGFPSITYGSYSPYQEASPPSASSRWSLPGWPA